MDEKTINAKLPIFLRKLATDIENEILLPEQLKRVGEFFMSYQFQEQTISDKNSDVYDFNDEDAKKFLTLGWYVYTQILKDKQVEINTFTDP